MRVLPSLAFLPLALAACAAEDEPFVAPPPPAVGLQLTMQPVTLQPGEDREYCTYFNLDSRADVEAAGQPFLLKDMTYVDVDPADDEIAIGGIEVRGAKGLHHIQILMLQHDVEDVPDRHIFECGVDLFGGPLTGDVEPLFFTSLNDYKVTYDEGVGRILRRVEDREDPTKSHGAQLLYNFHFLNSTQEPIEAQTVVNLNTVPRESVVHPVRSAWWNFIYFNAKPNELSQAGGHGEFKVDVNLVGMTSHQHETGTQFTYTLNGEQIYRNDRWYEPQYKVFPPGTVLTASTSLGFDCQWMNPNSNSRFFGLRADDEMCTAIVEYYPVDESAADALLEQLAMQHDNPNNPFEGEPISLERFVGIPDEVLTEIQQDPENALQHLDYDILCGIAINLKQLEAQYGKTPDVVGSLQGLLEYLSGICRL